MGVEVAEFDIIIFGGGGYAVGFARGASAGGASVLVLDPNESGEAFPEAVTVIRNARVAEIRTRPLTEQERLQGLARFAPMFGDEEGVLSDRQVASVILVDGRSFVARHQHVDTTDDADLIRLAAACMKKAA